MLLTISAGIIGLYTVFELIQRNVEPSSIAIIAEHLPGDQSIYYCSPFAGGYFTPILDDESIGYARYTYENLDKLKQFLGGAGCGIGRAETIEHSKDPIGVRLREQLAFIPDLEVGKSSVAECVEYIRFNGIVFNSPLLTNNMLEKFKLLGVTVTRKKLKSLLEIEIPQAIIFNCSGLGAYDLVNDPKVFSTRGQVIVVRAPHIKKVTLAWTADAATYVIPRPDSKTHEVFLGGFYQPYRLDANTYGSESEDILARVTKLCPEILLENANGSSIEDLEVLRTAAGARPTREGGVRIEKEETKYGTVIHNYGACGTGYLCGLGMAAKSLDQLQNL